MSASLVGSEMCIRDRSWKQGQSADSGPRGSECPSVCPWAFQRPGLTAVSYTHLTLPTICSV
eukprot:12226216-Alexandrium_andersonii.AAC.1